jgi:hypothetical protein
VEVVEVFQEQVEGQVEVEVVLVQIQVQHLDQEILLQQVLLKEIMEQLVEFRRQVVVEVEQVPLEM